MNSTPNVYLYRLEPQQRGSLQEIADDARAPAKKVRNARVLLLGDADRPGGKWADARIAEALGMHVNTVARVRKRYATEGERPALVRKPRPHPPTAPKIDGRVEAHLIALCTGPPPQGRARWTMQLLAGELIRQEIVGSISDETVRVAPRKTR